MKKASEKKLLVVGGSGFIGNHLVKNAAAKGFIVTVISLTSVDNHKKIESVEYINIDISIYDDLLQALSNVKFNYVVNLSGYVDHSNFFEKGKRIIDMHLNGVINLVNCLDRSELKRFIQIGSSDEYGNIAAPQCEGSRESPISPYSFAKVAITHFLQMLHKTEAFPSVILRLFIVYGPGQKLNRFIPQVISACINNQHFPVSEGSQLRDFCYVDDVVQAILMSY
jgi:nucleoside-diphosphate-sugar epimerase